MRVPAPRCELSVCQKSSTRLWNVELSNFRPLANISDKCGQATAGKSSMDSDIIHCVMKRTFPRTYSLAAASQVLKFINALQLLLFQVTAAPNIAQRQIDYSLTEILVLLILSTGMQKLIFKLFYQQEIRVGVSFVNHSIDKLIMHRNLDLISLITSLLRV